MPSKPIEVRCSICNGLFFRCPSSVRKAIKIYGKYTCKNCTLTKRNKDVACAVGKKRVHKQSGRAQIKTLDGWIFEHRNVMELYLGRKLDLYEIVHHCDLDKRNDDISNLELMLKGSHTALHNSGRVSTEDTKIKMSEAKLGVPSKSRSMTFEMAENIRKTREETGMSYSELAGAYGTTKGVVAHIIKKRSYNVEDCKNVRG